MPKTFIFSSESVGEGHPDKVADYISDSILDACLEQDPDSRVACETMVKSNCVFLAGEITTKAHVDFEKVARQAIREIGYSDPEEQFNADSVFITNAITRQSDEIAQGVDVNLATGHELGAGDQGIMFGYATKETPEFMPAPIMFAHRITQELARQRKAGIDWLRPDCKAQVAVRYEDNIPTEIVSVIISTQHTLDVIQGNIRTFCIKKIIEEVLPKELLTKNTEYIINPTGSFIQGGPESDAGLTGRKIIVDTYGGWSRHGGGAFSGKDATKVDRSAAYMCRWVAKNIVAAGIADQMELQVAYAIGRAEPTSIHLNTFGSSRYGDAAIIEAVKSVFSFKPADIIEVLGLKSPIFRKTTQYGHFTKPDLPWEQVNRSEELLEALNTVIKS